MEEQAVSRPAASSSTASMASRRWKRLRLSWFRLVGIAPPLVGTAKDDRRLPVMKRAPNAKSTYRRRTDSSTGTWHLLLPVGRGPKCTSTVLRPIGVLWQAMHACLSAGIAVRRSGCRRTSSAPLARCQDDAAKWLHHLRVGGACGV